MQKFISIIIPVWNAEAYISGCLDSVLKQTYLHVEIIAINDGSTDNSGKILDDFATKHPNVKVIHQANGGVSTARNKGLELATGEYVFFIDADDYLHPQALEILEKTLIASNVDAVECLFNDTELIYSNYRPQDLSPAPAFKIIEKPLTQLQKRSKKFTPTLWNKLYRRELIGALRFPDAQVFEDVAFVTCLAGKMRTAASIELKLVNYYCANNSLSRSNFTIKKLVSYDTGLRYIYCFYRDNFPLELPSLRGSLFSWYVRVMFNSVKKAKRKQGYIPGLQQTLEQHLYRLWKDGIISFKGLSWGKKISLLLLICKGKLHGRI